MAADVCPQCSHPAGTGDRFCEKCGHDLTAPATPATGRASVTSAAGRLRETRSLSSSIKPSTCNGCGGRAFGEEGYCEDCGQRRPAAEDHSELDAGIIAAVTDKGLRHHHNEDAVALGQTARALLAVVCDGVSSSNRSDTASHAAVDAAMAALIGGLEGDDSPADAIDAATRVAQAAAALAGGPDPGNNPPSSTFVCAVVLPDSVTVGWVGDSRAYWIPDSLVDGSAAQCLTVDDSLAGQLAAAGKTVPDDIPRASAGALLRWLGADAPDTTPHLYTFTPAAPGRVFVCSDGLFKYLPEPAQLAAAAGHDDPLSTARALVRLALREGGQDNITVAILPYPPEESP